VRAMQPRDVCFGSKADVALGLRHVRLPPKADIAKCFWDVCFVPKADICAAAKISAIRSLRRRSREGFAES
jgi:hypothetical protein